MGVGGLGGLLELYLGLLGLGGGRRAVDARIFIGLDILITFNLRDNDLERLDLSLAYLLPALYNFDLSFNKGAGRCFDRDTERRGTEPKHGAGSREIM